MSFSTLALSEPLCRAVADQGHTTPTPVQTAAIPVIAAGRDVLASAATGSGKTAAFVLPLLERLARQLAPRAPGRTVRALILVPTRELALQVGESVRRYGRYLLPSQKTLVVYGGIAINPQQVALGTGADVLVATPGRLLDLVDQKAVSLAGVSVLVLDEADRLLALGFSAQLGRILMLLPAQRQSLLFSATLPAKVESLARELLRDPVRLGLAPDSASTPDIAQRAIEVDAPKRTPLLRHLIETQGWSRVLVFVATKYATEHIADKLRRAGLAADALHGELSQGGRIAALKDFKSAKTRVLVATDVAARGLDITGLPAVVNYDLPRSAADYTHRIGRTGRAGEAGVAVSFITAETHAHFNLIATRHGLAIPREQIAGFEPVDRAAPRPLVAPDGGGIKGRRKSKKDKVREAAARATGELPPAPPPPAREPRAAVAPVIGAGAPRRLQFPRFTAGPARRPS
ncbi:MAG: DEAD/DEAH box helicase [Opitutaceae bacterium]|nr:DEAD/DEAH box helicase [Opitutaceae bacterium]